MLAMLRNGHRLCRVLPSGWITRCRFLSSTKSEQSVKPQLSTADVDAVKLDCDDSKLSPFDKLRSSKAVVKRPKPLTREPFVKNLFLGKFDTVSCNPTVLCIIVF